MADLTEEAIENVLIFMLLHNDELRLPDTLSRQEKMRPLLERGFVEMPYPPDGSEKMIYRLTDFGKRTAENAQPKYTAYALPDSEWHYQSGDMRNDSTAK